MTVLRVVLPVIYVYHIQFLRIYHDGLATRSSYNERVSRNRSDAGVYFKSRQKKTGSQNGISLVNGGGRIEDDLFAGLR